MALSEPLPSSRHLEAFETALTELAGLGRIPHGLAVDSNPLLIYNLGLSQCAESTELQQAATPESWRFFAVGGNPAVTVSGDVSVSTPIQVTAISYGKQVMRLRKNLLALQPYRRTSGDFGFLQIPGMSLEAFFLQSMQLDNADAPGAVIPYRHFFPDMFGKEFRSTPSAFFQMIKAKAIQIMNYKEPTVFYGHSPSQPPATTT